MTKKSGLNSQPAVKSAEIADPAAISLGSPLLDTGTSIYLTVRERFIINYFKQIGDGTSSIGSSSKVSKGNINKLVALGLIEAPDPNYSHLYRLTEKGKRFRWPKKWR